MYTSVLCLVALNQESQAVLGRARAIAEKCGADLHMLHVVEYVPLTGTEDAMLTAPVSIGDELEERAREQIRGLCENQGLPVERARVVTGDLVSELRQMLDEINGDLVVVGNHSRRGLSAIFDHAEDAILHRCSCDLLAVHLG